MRKLLLVLGLILFVHLCDGQPLYVDNGVDTSNGKVAAAINFYRLYLADFKWNANPDYSKYWRAKNLKQNKNPDPLAFAINSGFPSYLMSESRTLFYAKPFKQYVQLKTLFASADSVKNISVTCITNHYIGFDEEGKPFFISPIEINADNWRQVKRGNVTFHYPSYHQFNRARADSMIVRIKQLEKDWAVDPISFRYFFANSSDEIQRLRGFDFKIGMGNPERPSGMTDDTDNIIYAAGLGEGYFHEVVHLYLNRKFPASPLREGLATFYGGTLGHDLAWHVKRLHGYVQKHPEIDLNKFRDFQYMDHYTNPIYTIEGLLCLLAYQKDGLAGLKRIMTYTSLEDIFQKEFGVRPGQWNAFIRKGLVAAEQATAGPVHNP